MRPTGKIPGIVKENWLRCRRLVERVWAIVWQDRLEGCFGEGVGETKMLNDLLDAPLVRDEGGTSWVCAQSAFESVDDLGIELLEDGSPWLQDNVTPV